MKTTILTIAIATCYSIIPAWSQSEEASTNKSQLKAVLLDDQSGEELARDHGIQPISLTDLSSIIETVINNRKTATLLHFPIDEDALDSPVAMLNFKLFSKGSPPRAPSTKLPLRELQARIKTYKQERSAWQRSIQIYKKQVSTNAETFLRQVLMSQMEVSERFDLKLESRNGKDFNRSDIVGAFQQANELLKDTDKAFIVINSDCVDRPEKRKPQTTPLTEKQLDPKITLIFVNTSRKPGREVLFKGIKNPILRVDTMKAAMQIIATRVKETD